MQELRIIFMGTPDFAVPSLKVLVENSFNIVAVITAPDKPKGRGQKLAVSPVKAYSQSRNIPVLQPTNLKNPEFVSLLRSYRANLQVVVAFRMLPEVVWNMPEIGTFNLHASLLPDYRGAAPINWAIINGEKATGVTTFFLRHEIDTGDIIFQEKETIFPEDDAGSLYTRLMHKGAQLVLKTVKAIQKNDYASQPQDLEATQKKAPKIFKETCRINWQSTAGEIHNFIRGLSPYPAAWTHIGNTICKIYKSEISRKNLNLIRPGDYVTQDNHLYFKTADQLIEVCELQVEGKKRMKTETFLRGNKL
ncbi:MAG: methionyl-tRNA formyltransferase [Cytophagales bacterium]|nr:methionyl-tRNA formyltransferase [Cytophagales bacterium]